MKKSPTYILSGAIILLLAAHGYGQYQGPSTGSTPYILPTVAGYETISILTTDNTNVPSTKADDTVPKVGGGTYGFDGIPDGLGAFDNGNGTFTLLVNHEVSSGAGVARAHGGKGAFISTLVVNSNSLSVISGEDLIKTVYGWNAGTQTSNVTPISNAVFFRFCSADLPAPSAFLDPASGLGSNARIYLNGEEDGTHGWAMAHVATGPEKGISYVLGKFNLSTNGSGQTGVGNWETLVANPFPQDNTLVIGCNDGGSGIMNNALSVYVGAKQSTGTEADKAGLTNGVLKHVLVTGNPTEVVTSSTRATNITNGTRFTLSNTASTAFSRPEDGAWNPKNLDQFYFVTTDQLDNISDGLGMTKGQTRLWRLTFDDILNPNAGGVIDLLIDGRTVGSEKVNMFDNITVNEATGRVLLQEDVGNAAHNGKVWEYDPATDSLTKILQHDPARFGRPGMAATGPFNQDEEATGIIAISGILAKSSLNRGYTGEGWYMTSDQAHYTSGITTSQFEGGQLLVVHDISAANNIAVNRSGIARDRRTGAFNQAVVITNNNATALTGPLYLVLDSLSANASLTNASDTTTATAPTGSPYLAIPVSSLASGASTTVSLVFSNPTNAAINYTTRVLSGAVAP